MLLKSMTITPQIYHDRKAEVIIDPNPAKSKFCYLHLILNADDEFQILEQPPEHACTQEEISNAAEYGKRVITSSLSVLNNAKDDVECQALKLDPLGYKAYKDYQETLTQFAKYVRNHAMQDGSYKQALKDYVKGYFRASSCKDKTQKSMRQDVLNMFKTIYGSHPDVYVETFKISPSHYA